MQHRKRLFMCFAGGTAAIVLLRLFMPSLAGAGLAALAACGAIGWLGLLYWREGTDDLSRAGDDLYYLGLLFTLVSLMYALIALFIFNPEGDIEQRTYALIGNFGIALLSTVIGILGRILLQGQAVVGTESQPAPHVAEEAVDANRDALEELRLQIRHATDAFRHFTRVTTEQAEENRVHMRRQIEQSVERMNEEARNSLLETQAAWLETLKKISTHSETMIGQIEREVTSSTQRTETAWQDLARRANETSTTTQKRLDNLVKEMASMLQAMSELNRTLAPLSKGMVAVTDNVRDLGETTAGVVGNLSVRATEMINVHDELAHGAKKYQEDSLRLYEQALRSFTQVAAKKLTDEINACVRAIQRIASTANAQQNLRQRPRASVRRMLGLRSTSGGRGLAKARTASRSLVIGKRR
ncbi:MAG: hypothetical protein OXQ86_11310 [Gammaproteobacteria bacterium]|nr:hypothetical protein [Gammaproteobacteria bacterium]MDE0415256.1 hypothetical protein [Gammaproteobacteria bacterium]